MTADKLASALARRRALGLPSEATSAYRLVHGEGDGLPGLTVDVYDQHLVASLYTEVDDAREPGWIDALAGLGFRGVYVKRRPRQASRLAAQERSERAPEHVVFGEDAAPELVVRENGVPFAVRLGDGLSTGLFLDQRDNRARVLREARGKSVLNLFAYTCAFGAVAAAGGACRTVNIDVAKPVLERGRQNYALAGVDCSEGGPGDHTFLARDVLDALPRLARKPERFDLVVLDPPSFASTRKGSFSVERDYPTLATLALGLVASGGTLLACTNHHQLEVAQLVRAIELGAKGAARVVDALEVVSPPRDHPPSPGRTPHLKSAWIRLS